MAGTTTITYQEHRGIHVCTFTWLCDASGDADDGTTKAISGELLKVVTDPDGTDVPTDNYDIVLNDENGLDVAAAGLGNRDTANTEQALATLGSCFDGTLNLVVSNAGNAKRGVVKVFYRP